MKNVRFLYIIIGVLIIAQIYSVLQINNLKDKVKQGENGIYNIEQRLDQQISSIYNNVNEKLKEKASIVSFCSYEIGELNQSPTTVPVIFTVEPKSLTQTTKVSLKFDNEIMEMQRQGTEFKLTKNFEITENPFPTIIIEDNGTQNFEHHDNLSIYSLKDNVFTNINPRFEGETGHNEREPFNYFIKGNISIDYKEIGKNKFTDVKYVVSIDDEVVKTIDIPIEYLGTGRSEIDDKFELQKGQILVGNIIAKDEFGFTHEYSITHYLAGSRIQRDLRYEKTKITASDGTVIYDFDENGF